MKQKVKQIQMTKNRNQAFQLSQQIITIILVSFLAKKEGITGTTIEIHFTECNRDNLMDYSFALVLHSIETGMKCFCSILLIDRQT